MNISPTVLRASIEVGLDPDETFAIVVGDLRTALGLRGVRWDEGVGSLVTQGAFTVARIVAWEPGRRIACEWHQASWAAGDSEEVELRFDGSPGGTTIVLEHRSRHPWRGGEAELAGWFASAVAAPLIYELTPQGLGSWITDRKARRPSGAQSRSVYRDPLYHYPNFRVILEELALTPRDYLIDVCCGGGALLAMALRTGCRAAGIDHSPEMVRVAQTGLQAGISEGRVDIREASAEQIPFPDGTFTAASLTGAFGFLKDPVAVLAEIRRVLQPGGRLVALGSDPAFRGTPAAPEPIASYLRFYDDDEFATTARKAGFSELQVVRREMEAFAREAGIPAEALPLFRGPGAPFLIARKT